ncbi:DUF1330 domain-containing protein [Phenylobacterium sp.]|uniref:DUF1330 domain-containing protein n=1 Tax=Phenylobacterium sp. TaxID=1871053 RepID=UPI0035AEEBC9
MTAYVVNEITVTDPETYRTYAAGVPETLAKYGGRFLVRGGAVEAVDGEPPTGRIVIVEFPSMAQARAWRNSPEYGAILGIRNAASTSRVFIVEGA